MARIRIRGLRLRGVTSDYDVRFVSEQGSVRSLAVIAGEISTGKSSILELIDWCLGASDHPRHPEIAKSARSALLEVELADSLAVIERPLFSSRGQAAVHYTSLDRMADPHRSERRLIEPPGSEESLSYFLLEQLDLAGVRLKEAPSKAESDSDPLSFRDLMPLAFLPNHRLDNLFLLFENEHMRFIKLRQVIDIVFGVYDETVVALSAQLDDLSGRKGRLEGELATLKSFLAEHRVPRTEEIRSRQESLVAELELVRNERRNLDLRLRATADFATDVRKRHDELAAETGLLATRLRDRETLLARLLPLRGQYAADEKRLMFFDEAKRLFDPLNVSVCPACLQHLPKGASIADGHCSLCGQDLPHDAPGDVDVARELRSLRVKLAEINRYIADVEQEIDSVRGQLVESTESQRRAQVALDEQTTPSVAPFFAQRDQLVEREQVVEAELATLPQALGLNEGVADRERRIDAMSREIGATRDRLQTVSRNRPSRDALVQKLSDRFESLLAAFGFPKLYGARIDDRYQPHARGRLYRSIGSTGALTLISIAWQLTVFELAVEQDRPHPGFLMIDSPQKNLSADTADPDFRDQAIHDRIYRHLIQWTNAVGPDAQVILVDNSPPLRAEPNVIVRYSADAARPPYGLIHDETGIEF